MALFHMRTNSGAHNEYEIIDNTNFSNACESIWV